MPDACIGVTFRSSAAAGVENRLAGRFALNLKFRVGYAFALVSDSVSRSPVFTPLLTRFSFHHFPA